MIDQGKARTLPPRQPYRTNIASPLQTCNRADASVTSMARASYPLPTSDKGHTVINTSNRFCNLSQHSTNEAAL